MPIIPNIRVKPEAIKNSIMPYANPCMACDRYNEIVGSIYEDSLSRTIIT